ncbi:Immunoglobulin lambda variable 1-40 [Plecturocebus cupreus]
MASEDWELQFTWMDPHSQRRESRSERFGGRSASAVGTEGRRDSGISPAWPGFLSSSPPLHTAQMTRYQVMAKALKSPWGLLFPCVSRPGTNMSVSLPLPGSWAQSVLTQAPSVSWATRQGLTISCTESSSNIGSGYNVTCWQQLPGTDPKLLMHSNKNWLSWVSDQFSSSRSGNLASLAITELWAEDETECHCQSRDSSPSACTVLQPCREVGKEPPLSFARWVSAQQLLRSPGLWLLLLLLFQWAQEHPGPHLGCFSSSSVFRVTQSSSFLEKVLSGNRTSCPPQSGT